MTYLAAASTGNTLVSLKLSVASSLGAFTQQMFGRDANSREISSKSPRLLLKTIST